MPRLRRRGDLWLPAIRRGTPSRGRLRGSGPARPGHRFLSEESGGKERAGGYIPPGAPQNGGSWRRCAAQTKQEPGVYQRPVPFCSPKPLATVVTAIGAGVGVWGVINLMEGYGGDNPASKSQGVKQLMAGGGVILLGLKVVPLLSGLLG